MEVKIEDIEKMAAGITKVLKRKIPSLAHISDECKRGYFVISGSPARCG
jgi:hypothetical protein